MAPSYNKGDFQSYRAITKIHLGALSDNLHEGEEVEYDGFVMKRGGDEHALHTLRAAIKVGWLVPVAAPSTTYVPQPAGVKVHKADGMSNDEVLDLDTVFDEDVNVGTLAQVRPANAPPTHRADRASEKRSPDDGVVVGRFKTSAKQAPVEIGRDDRKVVQELDNKTKVEVEKVAVATGDVQEAIGGDTLVDLLPNAESSGVPKAGVAGEGRGDEADARAQEVSSRAASADPAADALSRIRQFIPAFEWDLDKTQWAKRAKIAVEKYGDIPPVLDYIMSVETDTVKRHIEKRLEETQR